LHHIAFELPTPDALLALYRQLKEVGVPIVSARKGGPGNQPRFYVHDPDRNLLEFYWGIDMIGWDGRARPYDPIEEINLEDFDFESYVARREADALAAGRPSLEQAASAVGASRSVPDESN
jgi:catechol-2,3-dioxygenase